MIARISFLFICIISSFQVTGQDNQFHLKSNYIIAFHAGFCSSVDFCEQSSGNSYLKFGASQLIPFNEHSTFEDRLNLDKLDLKLTTGTYEVIFIDENLGRIDSVEFHIDSIFNEPYVNIKYDFVPCFQGLHTKYIHFDSTSLNIKNTFCNHIDSIYAEIMESDNPFELTGITSEIFSADLAEERVLFVYNTLVNKGVPKKRLILRENVDQQVIAKPPLLGVFAIYPPEGEECVWNGGCSQGVRVMEVIDK